MSVRVGGTAATALIAMISGCATSPRASQVQVSVNFPSPAQHASHKSLERGAISGVPQHVGFFYSVNPDCSSNGPVQTQLKSPPTHGSVTFVEGSGYTNFPSTSPGYDCNKQKSPGVEVMYTSAKDFVGTDQFTVQAIGPQGVYMESDYTVQVLAAAKTQ